MQGMCSLHGNPDLPARYSARAANQSGLLDESCIDRIAAAMTMAQQPDGDATEKNNLLQASRRTAGHTRQPLLLVHLGRGAAIHSVKH